jgi:uracil-DNA glycosylase
MTIKCSDKEWNDVLSAEYQKPYFIQLMNEVEKAFRIGTVYPPPAAVFKALDLCPLSKVKVVIIGQDPYHGEGQAHGLCFSVNNGVKFPPSLRNIFKELNNDIPGFTMPLSGNLEKWAAQGVLLLNATLTVSAGSPGSHKGFGWEKFTDAIIEVVNKKKSHVVFMLWGNFAFGKEPLIDHGRHLVLKAAHPSPLARGAFFGCRHFSRANDYLSSHGLVPVDWRL